jgi:hypothetical protein
MKQKILVFQFQMRFPLINICNHLIQIFKTFETSIPKTSGLLI